MRFFPLLKKLLICIVVYLCYCGISVYIYTIHNINDKTEIVKKRVPKTLDGLLAPQFTNELVGITNEINDALALRCQLVDAAEKTLLISQYTIGDDDSGLIFLGKIFEAAKRGVKIKILMNGLSSKMTNSSRIPLAIFDSQPNIEVKMVGGINLLKPWRMNNVMHDKLIITDNKYFMSSGRNIQKRFMLPSNDYEPAYDLDVVVQSHSPLTDQSVITQGKNYFAKLWTNPYATNKKKHGNWAPNFITRKSVEKLDSNIFKAKKRHDKLISRKVLENMNFHPIKSGYLVHNSVNDLVKEPIVWQQLAEIINQSKVSLTIASPYVVFTKKMQSFLQSPSHANAEVLTNAPSNSPNLLAFGGYLNQKEWLLKDSNVWEYQGKGSLHQKAMLVDGQLGIIGSFNFDSRSTYLSSENMLIVNSPDFYAQLEEFLTDYKENSLKANENFDYVDNQSVAVSPINQVKKKVLLILSWITKPFSFLL